MNIDTSMQSVCWGQSVFLRMGKSLAIAGLRAYSSQLRYPLRQPMPQIPLSRGTDFGYQVSKYRDFPIWGLNP